MCAISLAVVAPQPRRFEFMTKKSTNATQARGPTPAQRKQQSVKDKLLNALDRLPKGTFAKAGGAIGGLAYGPPGAAAGTMLGSAIAHVTGRGDYVVRSNSIMKSGMSIEPGTVADSLPTFQRNKHVVSIKHREYFGDLVVPVNPTTFNNVDYVLNPGNASLFPWLAAMARQYQQYRIKGMLVEFKSNTSDYAASGPLGVVGIAANYNVADEKYDTLVKFENSEYAVVSKPSRDILHAIECSPLSGRDEWLYVRDASAEDPNFVQDRRFCDFARLQIATSGLPGTPGNTLGQLWVTYDIEFTKPIISDLASQPILYAGRVITSNASGTLVNNATSNYVEAYYENVSANPSASTSYVTFDPAAATFVQGDNLEAAGVIDFNGSGVRFHRPGDYFIELGGSVTLTGGVTRGLGASQQTDKNPGLSTVGSGAGTLFFHQALTIPTYFTNVTGTNTHRYAGAYHLHVTVADANNYVVLTPANFTSFGTAAEMVTGWVRSFRLTWLESATAQVKDGTVVPD